MLTALPKGGIPTLSLETWLSRLGMGAVPEALVLVVAKALLLLALTGLGVDEPSERLLLLLLLPAPLLPPAASSLAARALVWCRTDLMWISRVELWL